MELLPADWVFACVALAFAVGGAVVGFSGAVSMAGGLVSAAFSSVPVWRLAAAHIESPWGAGFATFAACMAVFALVRVVLKKTIHVMLAQPADSLLGAALGCVLAAAIFFAWMKTGIGVEYSALAIRLSGHV